MKREIVPASLTGDRVAVAAREVRGSIRTTDDGKGDELAFPLKQKNYDDLRVHPAHVPAILVVVCVPPDLADWIDDTPDRLALRRCAYWLALHGQPATDNERSTTVHLPRAQRFTVDALRAIMGRIGDGGMP